MIQAINQNKIHSRFNAAFCGQEVKPAPNYDFFSVTDVMLPVGERKYSLFNQNKVNFIASQKEHALPYLKDVLEKSSNEEEIVESIYIVDKLVDNGTKGISAMYPTLAKHNETKSSNVQAMLAGVYRKTQVPDAFGPLVSMLIKNSIKKEDSEAQKQPFDSNEEIGGAILSYIENYSHNPKKIDYSV